ncbi:MAG: hypothetical protein UT87_C0021G0003 [Candidatus Levybacteria bacterium GW2011_GWC1_40_19]|nr:MAG: hypothetical protein UT46_C0001G0022 [Candidatus Levybacteria bacterium GW2011_GWA1_39_34]KKR50043.1 MAG: hypothetical protein UT87_C0021G0003 [Candidatus Levybacteria bacterium GW2011_GWC1_40_19]KKR94013.1 MAG: hypothetical protein UU45_C0018G0003 [Candidatus Levybacteria bacterium GW2011_GWA2_41_15]KKS01572.1 MAG: hypothetical protein UU52_C0010G0007 [Candidatus Levybacteria bacterium GW2011_GWB1_41_21]OGH21014.1 MAG: hypothetical protein A2695_02410 [Candidatus Levybacteria bacterium
MSTETKPSNLTGYIPPGLSEKISGVIIRPGSTFVSRRIVENTKLLYPQDFLTEYVRGIDEGYAPIVVSNHASHADAAVVARLTSLLRKIANRTLPNDGQVKGFNVPLAKSLLTGHQGAYLRQAYLGTEPVIEDHGFFAVPIARPQDQDPDRYGMPGNEREYLANTRRRMQNGFIGTVLFPEGTTEGGKSKVAGKVVGMIKFQPESIPRHIRLTQKHTKKKVMIIPVGITGGRDAINPDTKKAPLRLLYRLMQPNAFGLFAGKIIREDDPDFAMLQTSEEINEYVGRRIAKLLPPEMRGVYS